MPTKTANPKRFSKTPLRKLVFLVLGICAVLFVAIYFFIKSLASQIVFA